MLNYVSRGDKESPVVLLLHGFMGSANDWDRVADTISEDFLCVVPDLPGHGGSTDLPDESYTMEGAAWEVVRLLDELGVPRATVAGYSMGGRLALYLALRHPERYAGLFLESASPGHERAEERTVRRAADEERAKRLEYGNFEEFLRDWYCQPLFASLASDTKLLRWTIEARRRNDPEELARSLRGMGTGSQPPLWRELEDLSVPAFAAAGTLDQKYAGISSRMASLSPWMESVVVPETGHNVHDEAPAAYISLLARFLDGLFPGLGVAEPVP